jgi:hypothetical protein
MPDEPIKDTSADGVLAVPGVLCVSPTKSGRKVVYLGPSAGWMIPRGIQEWEQEVSFIRRADMTAELAKALHATLPHEQIAPKRFATAARAVEASPLLPIASNLAEAARKEGVRVHTVGVDRVSADFYYFAEGGAGEALRVQGNLVEMIADRVSAATTNAEIEALQVSLIQRLLSALSEGVVSELDVELAGALPRLSRDGTGLEGTDLKAFEAQAQALALESARFEAGARRLAEVLATATGEGETQTSVPLFGKALRETMAPLEVSVMGKPLQLPECSRWTVTGAAREMRIDSPAKLAPRPVLAPAPTGSNAAASMSHIEEPQRTTATTPAAVGGEAKALQPPVAEVKPVQPPASKPEPAKPVAEAEPAKPTVVAPTRPERQVAAEPAASRAPAPLAAQRARASPARALRDKRAVGGTSPAHAPALKRQALVPILLLLGLVTSLYFLWRSMP